MHDYAHGKINLSSVGSYKLLWKHLLPDVYTTEYSCAFSSILFNRIKKPCFFTLRHEKFAQWTSVLFNVDAEIYWYFLGLMQEYQTFWYSQVIFSIKQTKAFTYNH